MVVGTCTQRGIVFQKADLIKTLRQRGFDDLKSQLTITKTKRMGHKYTTREEHLYMEFNNPNILVISRFSIQVVRDVFKKYAPNHKWRLQNNIPAGEDIPPARLIVSKTFKLDSNQQLISDYLDEHVFSPKKIRSTRSSTVLVMKTGLGKTYVGVAKIREIKKKTLIIVPSKAVMDEWRKALTACFPSVLVGDYMRKTDGDVVIMVVNTATKDIISVKMPGPAGKLKPTKIKYFDYFKRFGFVIYDEIHNYTSTVKQKALWRTNMACCLGLTATPSDNAWGMDIIFQKHVGPLLHAEKIPEFNPDQTTWKGIYNPYIYTGPPEYTETKITPATGWTSHPKMINQFASDPYRTVLLLDLLNQLYVRGRNVFVFFKTRLMADQIQELLLKFIFSGTVHQIDNNTTQINVGSTVLMGGATDIDKTNAAHSSIVLTTYGYGWQGVSIPKMDTLVFATPRMAKMEQIIGRILRKSGDTTIVREIWDIVDQETELGRKEYTTRRNAISKIVKFPKSKPINVSWKDAAELPWVHPTIMDIVKQLVKIPDDE